MTGVALVVAIVATVVVHRLHRYDDAETVATTYVDLIAHGGPDDEERLWALNDTGDPGAMRTAGELLVGAKERIEVLDVGGPSKAQRPDDLSWEAPEDTFVQVAVRYRLAGHEQKSEIVLGRAGSGSKAGPWKVLTPLTGSIGWTTPGFTSAGNDLYVSGVRQVRRPSIYADEEDVQPLYPAVYRVQSRLDPYFASPIVGLPVSAGAATKPPQLPDRVTPTTVNDIREQVHRIFDLCGNRRLTLDDCPFSDIAQRLGLDGYDVRSWWRGMVKMPTVTVGTSQLTLSGGVARIRTHQGVRRIRFKGTGPVVLDNQSWRPMTMGIEWKLTEVGR